MLFKHYENTPQKLSIMLIVLDEENLIKQWFDHLKNYNPFEVVVVDGGSTDQTKTFVNKYGSHFNLKLIEQPMGDSFAEQRNLAKKHCRGDWILALDADETLSPNSPAVIDKIIHDQSTVAFSFPRVALFPDPDHFIGQPNADLQLRLFRNLPEISYIYKVHERPAYKGKPIHPGFFGTDQGWQWCRIKREIKMIHWGNLKSEAELLARGNRWQKFKTESKKRGLAVGAAETFAPKKTNVKSRPLSELF